MNSFARRVRRAAPPSTAPGSTLAKQNNGTWSGSSFTVTLPSAPATTSTLVLMVAGNTTVTTPSGWTLRSSQVAQMGHYVYTIKATSSSSWTVSSAAGQGTWWIGEVTYSNYESATSANDTAADTTYTSPNLTPTAGSRMLIASLAGLRSGTARTVSGWTNSFTEVADVCRTEVDYPMQGVATRSVTASGSTAYSTGVTYSGISNGRSAIILSLSTSSGGGGDTQAPTVPTGLNSSNVTSSALTLSWTASTDNVGVDHYNVYRDGSQIGTSVTTSYNDFGLTASTAYSYTVRALDAEGNISANSSAHNVTTGAYVPPSGWPDATNTGYTNAPGYPGSLTPYTGTIQSNTTYSFRSFDPGYGVTSNATNVTFYGCRFNGKDSEANWNVSLQPGTDNITFDYCSFIPRLKAAPPAAYADSSQFGIWQHPTNPGKVTVDHCDFWGFGNGIQFVTTNNQSKPFTLQNSWMHDARADGGTDHTDGILNGGNDGSYTVVHHNTISSAGNTNAIAFQDNTDNGLVITENWVSGFGYTVYVGHGTNTNVTFTDNVFSTELSPIYGPLHGWPGGTGNVWRRNKWAVPSGAAYGNPAWDGQYWWPGDGKNSGGHATDYTGN